MLPELFNEQLARLTKRGEKNELHEVRPAEPTVRETKDPLTVVLSLNCPRSIARTRYVQSLSHFLSVCHERCTRSIRHRAPLHHTRPQREMHSVESRPASAVKLSRWLPQNTTGAHTSCDLSSVELRTYSARFSESA